MKEIWNWIQLALSAVGGALGWFFGGMDGLIYALLVFVISASCIAEKYGLEIGSIYREIDLINVAFRANMV